MRATMDGYDIEQEINGDDITIFPKLRRGLNNYKPTRKNFFIKSFENEVKQLWDDFAPKLNYDELDIMLENLQPIELQTERNQNLIAIVIKLFQTAFDSKDKKGKIQFGSLLAVIYPNHGLIQRITKRNLCRRLFTTLKFHNANIGCGMPLPQESVSERNFEMKVSVIKDLIQFCYDTGKRTAKVRKVKGWNKPLPVLYRTMTIKSLISRFVQHRLKLIENESMKFSNGD